MGPAAAATGAAPNHLCPAQNWDSSAPTLVVRTVPEASEAEEAEEAEESLSADAADQGAASNDVQPTTIGFPGQWRDAVGSVAILDASRDEGSFDDGHGSTTNPVNRVVGFADKVLAFRPEVHTGVVAAPGTDQE